MHTYFSDNTWDRLTKESHFFNQDNIMILSQTLDRAMDIVIFCVCEE